MVKMDQSDGRSVEQLPLPPGFRFYPTDEELVWHYLRKKAESEPFQIPIIAEVDLYKFDPWDLPEKALFGEKDWFFFSPRDRKYPNGARPNRAAASGYWKATGTDKPIYLSRGGHAKVGVKKSLVFYRGKAPKGDKTNWIMHEYRLAEGVAPSAPHHRRGSLRLDDWVLCKIYEKFTNAQRAGHEHDMESMLASLPEIDDDPRAVLSGLQNSLGGTESAAKQEALVDNTSENGGLSSLQTEMMTSNPSMISVQNLQTSAMWELQQAMATTSNHNLDKAPFTQELASGQTLNMAPSMACQFGEIPQTAYNSYVNFSQRSEYNSLPTISDEESHSTFQSSVYGMESNGLHGMYPAIGYDHHADRSTASYATPALTENSVIPGNFDSFSYAPPGNNINFN